MGSFPALVVLLYVSLLAHVGGVLGLKTPK